MPLVVVTGITGFTGSWVCLEFLRSGQFRVRGTTRDLENESKLGPVRRGFGESIEMLEIVQMNLLDPESVDKAFEGATYVVNCAGPVQMEHKDD